MAGQLSNLTAGITHTLGERAVTVLTINGRARAPQGSVNLVTDVVVFPPVNPAIPAVPKLGQWVTANPRVRVMGVPVIDSGSVGIVYKITATGPQPLVAYNPMTVIQGDPRAFLR